MKITIEREGAETKVIETDNAVIITSTEVGEKSGTSTDVMLTKANSLQLHGIVKGCEAVIEKIFDNAPQVLLVRPDELRTQKAEKEEPSKAAHTAPPVPTKGR